MISRVVALGCVGMMACGHGGGGPEAVRLAVGNRVVDVEEHGRREPVSQSVILRDDGDGWVVVGENVAGEEQFLADVSFASTDVAWAWGSQVLRSRNAGATWEDVEANLPAEFREGPFVLRSLAFADAHTGYLGAYSVLPSGFPDQGPFVWVTRDGGETWRPGEDLTVTRQEVGFALGPRAGIWEILRHSLDESPGAVVQGFDGADYAPQPLTTLPTFIIRGVDAVGERGWAAVAVLPGDDFVESRPAIFSSARPGAPWEAQAVPDVRANDFGALDMCDAEIGLAGGTAILPTDRPVLLWTENGGGSWQTSQHLPDGELKDVLCVGAGEMLAVTIGGDVLAPVSTLFRSADGGRTFSPAAASFPDRHRILALASNAAFR